MMSSMQSDADALKKYQQHESALAWMRANGKKEKEALKTGRFPDITARSLKLRRTGKVRNGEEFADRMILTTTEELQLAKWIVSEARAGQPKDRDETDETRLKIVEILEHRRRTRGSGTSR